MDSDETSKLCCAQCSRQLPTKSHLAAHLIYTHHHRYAFTSDTIFACLHCERICSRHDNLDKHLWLHQPASFRCSKCSASFKRPDYLTSHLRRIHGITERARTDCLECGKDFKFPFALSLHSTVHKFRQLQQEHNCHVCNRTFPNILSFRSHLSIFHKKSVPITGDDIRPKTRYECARCLQTFPTRTHITVHFQNSHDLHSNLNKLILYNCHICNKSFVGVAKFDTHLTTHGERTLPCPQCTCKFRNSSNLRSHVLRYHKDADKSSHTCGECGKKCKTRGGLTMHSRYHKPQQISCDLCGIKFFILGNLRAHLNAVHSSGKHNVTNEEFKCKICGKQLGSYEQMSAHKYDLHQPRRMKCPFCNQQFNRIQKLRNHISRIHSNMASANSLVPEKVTRQKIRKLRRVHKFAPLEIPHKWSTHNRTYICAICCRSSGSLKSNLITHLGCHYKK